MLLRITNKMDVTDASVPPFAISIPICYMSPEISSYIQVEFTIVNLGLLGFVFQNV